MRQAISTGYVYALLAGPFVKIGFTAGTIAARMNELSTGCPYPLTCIGYTEGGMDLEKKLHEEFGEWRVQGEWFRLDPIHHNLLERLPGRLGAWGEPT